MEADQRILLPRSRSCFVCGRDNPQGLRARVYQVGDEIEMDFVPRREFAGWAEVVHGGLTGTVLDEVMTWAAIVSGRKAYFAAEYGVRMRVPLPLEHPCQARARVAGARRQVLDTEAWLVDEAGTVFARATGRYLPAPAERLAVVRHDFLWSEDCLDLRAVLEPQA